jgi:hypothetical protein
MDSEFGFELSDAVQPGPEQQTESTPTEPAPVSLEPAQTRERATDIRRATDYANRLRIAVGKISDASDSSIRGVLDAYFPLINPKRVRQGQQFFPRTVRHHARSFERSTENSGKIGLLFFAVGNAVLGIYDSVLAAGTSAFGSEITALGDRVRLLEYIALHGLASVYYDGDESRGWALQVAKPASNVPKPNLNAFAQTGGEVNPNADLD